MKVALKRVVSLKLAPFSILIGRLPLLCMALGLVDDAKMRVISQESPRPEGTPVLPELATRPSRPRSR
jgi:hypothetical protein